jgi:acetolactate synthase-1/2/3 large subunit
MKTAWAVMEALRREGVEVIFGVPGGASLPLYDALYDNPQIRHVLVRHEQCAVHMAEGYARATGKPGVCFTTSGPGATNLVTGLTDAMMDSTPVVAITGQVPTFFMGGDAFQEADVIGLTMSITKHNWLVRKPAQALEAIHAAFRLATEGRPGPTLVGPPPRHPAHRGGVRLRRSGGLPARPLPSPVPGRGVAAPGGRYDRAVPAADPLRGRRSHPFGRCP